MERKRMSVELVRRLVKGRWVWVIVLSVLVLASAAEAVPLDRSIQAFISNQSWTTR